MPRPSSWLTCAPRDFDGDESFFARDTGLLSRGLIACGARSRAVLIGSPRADDSPDLLRVPLSDLTDPAWWRAQAVDAVILQTWSLRPFTPIAAAIRAAGCRLVLIQDSSGITGPFAGWADWVRESWYFSRAAKWGALEFLARMLHGHTLRLFRFEKERARQFALADLVAVPSPPAVTRYRQLARRYGGQSLEEKVRLVPHAVAPWFTWSGAAKENRVAAVGRWDDLHQKRPDLLAAALQEFLAAHPVWQADIFGSPGPLLEKWRASLPADLSTRVTFHGRVASHDLARHLDRAKILFCPSAFESFHIASGEALCTGASVVAADSGMTATHRWFVSAASGTLAPRLDARDLASALTTEAAAWDAGHRDPASISATWCSRLHAPRVAEMLIQELA